MTDLATADLQDSELGDVRIGAQGQPTTVRARGIARARARAAKAEFRNIVTTMRLAGHTWAQVAEKTGRAESTCQEVWEGILTRQETYATPQVKAQAIMRYERLLRRFWVDTLSSDPDQAEAAAGHVKWITERLDKIQGTYAPLQVDATLEVRHEISFEDIERKVQARLDEIAGQQPAIEVSAVETNGHGVIDAELVEPEACP